MWCLDGARSFHSIFNMQPAQQTEILALIREEKEGNKRVKGGKDRR